MKPPDPKKIETHFCFTKASLIAKVEEFTKHSTKAQLDCYDSKMVGLIATIYRNGQISFRTRPAIGNMRPSIALGDYSQHLTIEQARSACAGVRLMVKNGVDPRAEKRKNITFAELFMNVYTPLAERKRSWKGDVQKFERWLRRRFGNMPVSSITSVHIADFLSMLERKEKLAPATVNRYRSLISAIFTVAKDEGIVTHNPTKNVPQLTEGGPRKRVIDGAELKAFVAACEADQSQASSLFMLLLSTGARLGEALGAKVADVQIESGIWLLPETKAGEEQIVHLSQAARALLTKIVDGRKSGFLFPGKDPAKALTRPAKAFARICAIAGVDGSDGQTPLVPHDLRRSFCSILARRGVEPAKLMKLMRHSSIHVTMKYYTHLQDKALVEASDIVGELLMD
jgi:integrase